MICVCVCFSTLCLQVGNRLGFWGGFSCFVSFIWCHLFACLIRAAIFCLPPAFVVWSFFLCRRHLWSILPQAFVVYLSFFATGICVRSLFFHGLFWHTRGICVRLFVFALLALVSGYHYQCIPQFLVSCCALAACQLHPWWFELELFPSLLPCGQLSNFRFEAKVYEIEISKVLATQMGVTEVQHQSQLVWIVQIWPIFAAQWADSGTRA